MEDTKLLIVDDDPDYTAVIKAILEDEKYSVSVASDRNEGIEKIKTERPALIILDVMMSTWSDGFEMSRELKNDPELKNIPILMLTGVESKTGIEFKSSAGDPDWLPVEGFLDKSADPQILLDEVKKLLSATI
jgi:two-component system alkaline phosphatase synthesis response regulator PhoP